MNILRLYVLLGTLFFLLFGCGKKSELISPTPGVTYPQAYPQS
jgi:hypothetical protein